MSVGPGAVAGRGIGAAYDAIAGEYDELVAEDFWMRRVLWRRYARAFHTGARVLDLGCGTGQDALYLAARGIRVTALDRSPGMLERLRARARGTGFEDRIELHRGDAGLTSGWPVGSWDGVISSFAALNTVAELGAVAETAADRLRPGGRMIVHLLAPAGLPAAARGGAGSGPDCEHAVEVAGRSLPHRVLPALEAYRRFFAARFELRSAFGLGFLWPQSWGGRLPPALAYRLGLVEPRLGRYRRFRDRGRFCVLELEPRSA